MHSIMATLRRSPSPLKFGVGALVIGFVVNVEIWSSSTRNGVVVSCTHLGLGEVVGGGLAVAAGLKVIGGELVGARTQAVDRTGTISHQSFQGPAVLAAGLALCLLGVVLTLKGLGVFWSRCG